MIRAPRALVALLCASAAVVAAAPRRAAAQGWSADLYAGGTQPQGVEARVTTTSLAGNLRYAGSSLSSFGNISLGAPLDASGALWGAGSLGGRAQRGLGARLGLGIDASADAYGFHDRPTDTSGGGAAVHALPFLSLALPAGTAAASLELRAGGHGHAYGGANQGSRGLFEVGARATLSKEVVLLGADARQVWGDSIGALYAGVQAVRAFARGRVWGSAGRWLGDLSQTGWEAGAALTAGAWGELWASVRQEATDPLYGNPQRRSWNVGFSRALGGRAAPLPAPVVTRGRARIRLPERSVPGHADAVAVAGEFNHWTSAPMTRADGDWVLELPLQSGVYRFAFVTTSGEWFVPDGYPGRVDDDMGGHVAVLVVP